VPSQNPAALVTLLGSPNRWIRDKAQMILHWQRDPATVPALTTQARNETNPLGRMHALHALEHLGALDDELLVAAFRDTEPGVREQALGLAERRTGDSVVHAAAALVKDPSPKVRLRLACALGEWKQPVAGQALVTLAREATDPILRGAIASSLRPHLDVFAARAHGDDELLDALFQTALGEHRPDVILTMLERAFATAAPADDASLRRVRALLIHLRARSLSLEELAEHHPAEPRWTRLVGRKQEVFAALRSVLPEAPITRQAFHATVLLVDPPEQTAALRLLQRLLAPQHGLHPLAEYVNHLARIDDPRVPDVLLRHWEQRTPGDRALILDAIMGREAWVPGLLARIRDGSIKASSFDAQRQARLMRHPSPEIRRQATVAFAATPDRSRQQVVELFRPALDLPGNTVRGRLIFTQTCAACHELEGTGVALGPDLRSVIDHPAEKLLVSILDPSADIQPGFAAYFCELKTGEQIYGSITAETGGSLDFRLADGSTRAILRSELKSLQSSNVSLMPEGLEASLTPQNLADLIAYLKAAK
jgi:putative heme-binding domain-containing protein